MDILQAINQFFSSSYFMPHGHCYLWTPGLLWTYVISDAMIGAAYFSIPIALFYFTKKRKDLAFTWMFTLFSVFILFCGVTHFMGVWTVWQPVYWLDASLRAVTAVASVVTAVLLWPLIPRALSLPSPALLRETNTRLEQEIEQRKAAEARLREAHAELEQRIAERTAELTETNERLKREIEVRRDTEAELELRARDLARSNADLESFAYVASHDLQEPLRTVSIYVQLLQQRYGALLDDDGKKFMESVVTASRRMQQQIRDVLALARISEESALNQTVACDAALDEAIDNLQDAIHRSCAIIKRQPLPEVTGNAKLISQLFQNLLGNALKFRGEEVPTIEISCEHGGNEWIFAVKDNGIGIEPQYAERIFMIFQRLHSQDDYPGTGIGLAICKKIVERHNGRIWVHSKPGEGATFFFSLPVERREA